MKKKKSKQNKKEFIQAEKEISARFFEIEARPSDAIEFAIFINNMLRFTDKMRANYLKEDPAFHPTVFKIVDSIKKASEKIRGKESK